MKINMSKKDVALVMTLLNRNNVSLNEQAQTAPSNFEANFHMKRLEHGRKLWSKLFDAQLKAVR